VRAAPFITRRFDAPRSYETTATVTTMRPEVVVIEEMKIYDEKPCAWWLFIILGILMLIMGVLNIIWCWQYHWFCRFWAGILVRILHCSAFRFMCTFLLETFCLPFLRYDTIRYDTIGEFNVDSNAEYLALSSTRSQKKELKQTTPVPLWYSTS